MSWQAVVVALDDGELLRSRVSLYRHPLAGRPVIWHVLQALADVDPPPERVTVVHRAAAPLDAGEAWPSVRFVALDDGQHARELRALVGDRGTRVVVDGAAPLLSPQTLARLLRAADSGVATLLDGQEHSLRIAVAGDGEALAAADDPRMPRGAARVAPTAAAELLRVVDRHTLADAALATHDRLVRGHEAAGVSFLLPATTWVDVDVSIGADTVVYPGVVLEGATQIGAECVIGPHSRLVEATVGRGVELRGWNYVTRTSLRNHAILEPYERRGVD